MGLFGDMKDMYKMQQQAKKIKKELEKVHVFAESDGIKVTVNGSQEVLSIEILDETVCEKPRKLEKSILECLQRAMKKSQQVAAERMKSEMGSLGMGGGK